MPGESRLAGPGPGYNARTRSDAQGLFSFANTPDGILRVCVQPSDPLLLDPCYWDARANRVAVSAGQSVNLPRVTPLKGLRVAISVLDPSALLPTRDWTRNRAPLDEEVQVAIRTPVLGFLPLQPVSIPGGRKFEMVVPTGLPIPVQIRAAGLQLEDPATGRRASQFSRAVEFGPGSAALTFRVVRIQPAR
jgi:hypothetical protein